MRVKSQVSRADIEATLWRWSGWTAEQRGVDAVLLDIDRYKLSQDDLDPLVSIILAEARAQAQQIVEDARRVAETMRPPPALCPGCEAAVKEAQAARQEAAERRKGRRPRVPETDRKCRDCGVVKGIDRFNKDVKSRNGRKAQCKECEAGQRKERRSYAKAKASGKRELTIKVGL